MDPSTVDDWQEDGPGWEQQDECERRFYDEAQQALKDDKEAYELWLDTLIREGLEYLTETVERENA